MDNFNFFLYSKKCLNTISKKEVFHFGKHCINDVNVRNVLHMDKNKKGTRWGKQ